MLYPFLQAVKFTLIQVLIQFEIRRRGWQIDAQGWSATPSAYFKLNQTRVSPAVAEMSTKTI